MQGVDNVYCQHTPLLVNTLGALRDGSLNTQAYPYMGATVRGRLRRGGWWGGGLEAVARADCGSVGDRR